MAENTYEVYYSSDKSVAFEGTEEEVRNFISNAATIMNYGLFRHWRYEDMNYYDCGPVTYCTVVDLHPEGGNKNGK